MKCLTKKPWFWPKYFGWGCRPITWQGWLSTGIFLITLLILARSTNYDVFHSWLIAPIILGYCVLCYLTGGSPGSLWFGEREQK
jgi:hypothetical protein